MSIHYNEALRLSRSLIDAEFDELNRYPEEYCRSMSWDKFFKGTKSAIKNKGLFCPNTEDYEDLTTIITSLDTNDTLEICEDDDVSDFLTNCCARHILKIKK